MKYLNRLFAFDERQTAAYSKPSTTWTSTLYSVIFSPEQLASQSSEVDLKKSLSSSSSSSSSLASNGAKQSVGEETRAATPTTVAFSQSNNQITILAAAVAAEAEKESEKHKSALGSSWWLPFVGPASGRSARDCNCASNSSALGDSLLTEIRDEDNDDDEDDDSREDEDNDNQSSRVARNTNTSANTSNCDPNRATPVVVSADSNSQDHNLQAHHQTSVGDIQLIEFDDWILLEEPSKSRSPRPSSSSAAAAAAAIDTSKTTTTTKTSTATPTRKSRKKTKTSAKTATCYLDAKSLEELKQMALDAGDLDLIKASWLPVRKDPVAAGVLLFRGLFTKFPQYLGFFPQFNDLDLERMQENKRLLRHATKVLETVSFVVDSIGDESKSNQLNEALVNLVRGHLNRRIGLNEFRNLGIVLIDFICDVNHRRDFGMKSSSLMSSSSSHLDSSKGMNQSSKSSLSPASQQSSQEEPSDQATMTTTLDKIRASSTPSSSSEEESYLTSVSTIQLNPIIRDTCDNDHRHHQDHNRRLNNNNNNNNNSSSNNNRATAAANDDNSQHHDDDDEASLDNPGDDRYMKASAQTKIDTNALVAAWTKLYGSILDLVRHEESTST